MGKNAYQPDSITDRLKGFIPQQACFQLYKNMFQDPDFAQCYGIKLSDEQIREIIERDMQYWDQYGFGPYVWFEKTSNEFVGEGGLNHTNVDGRDEIELTYSLSKKFWGRGFATEIGRFAIDQAFKQLKLSSIVSFTMPTNHRSLNVIKKLGFKFEKDFVYKTLPHQLFRLKNTDK